MTQATGREQVQGQVKVSKKPVPGADAFRRVLTWVVVWAVVVLGLQGLMSLLEWGGHLARPSGRVLFLMMGLGVAMAVLIDTNRSAGAYGLAVSSKVWWHALWGTLAGLVISAAVVPVLLTAGGLTIIKEVSVGEGVLEAIQGIGLLPHAVLLTVVLAGFPVGVLRDRLGRIGTALFIGAGSGVVVMLLGLWSTWDHPNQTYDPAQAWLGLSFAGFVTLVVGLRLWTGDVALASGFSLGVLMTDRMLSKLGINYPASMQDATGLIVGADPWASWPAWGVLAVVCTAVLVRVSRLPEQSDEDADISNTFKRVYPLGTLGTLAPLDVWIPELIRARFRIGLIYLPRLLATLGMATVNTVISLPERLLVPLFIRHRKVPAPVFVLGVHRSGTTHLQNLLAQDPQFVTPRAYHVLNPVGFLITGWFMLPLIMATVPWRRPMDRVRFSLWTPNEEEFAVANATGLSPDWSTRLPRLMDHYDRFHDPDSCTERERQKFEKTYLTFLRKLTLFNGKRPMLKNPYNTGRMALLRRLFPDAKFIHILRDPVDVYRSNRKMIRDAYILFQMQDPPTDDAYLQRFLTNYRGMEERYARDAESMREEDLAEVRFEELEQDAKGVIQRVYEQLNLEFSPAYEAKLDAYMESVSGYRKNKHQSLRGEDRARLVETLGDWPEKWGYPLPDATE